jgi:hypothetical protein
VTKTIRRPRPDPWRELVPETSVDVVPLVGNADARFFPGWVSYDSTVVDSPDVEIMCGGINEKPSIGAALWRQGQLLHFGFDLSPGEMNDAGRALLVNSIVYISRFHDEHALCVTPSAFAGGVRARASLAQWLANESLPLDLALGSLSAEAIAGIPRERAALKRWFDDHRDFLHPGAKGQLCVDADALAIRLPYHRIESLETAADLVADAPAADAPDSDARHARNLLERYVPEGPAAGSAPSEWRTWLDANRPYLFFSEWGGYRWYVDPLARARRVPSEGLRGPARADLEAVSGSR